MKFTFDPSQKFKCKKCGQCCEQYSFTISEKEMDFIKQNITKEQYSTKKYPDRFFLPYEIIFESDFCPFYKDNLCSVYKNRFSQCRFYPFDFIISPDNEVIIDIIKCNGVSKIEGDIIDENYINKLFNNIEDYDSEYLQKRINYLTRIVESLFPGFSGFDQVDFNTKMKIKDNLIDLINDEALITESSEIITRALDISLNQDFKKIELSYLEKIGFIPFSRNPRFFLSVDEVDFLWNDYINKYKESIKDNINYAKTEKLEIFKKQIERGYMNTIEGKNVVTKSIDDNVNYRKINGNRINLKINEILKDVPYSDNSILLMNEYLCEVIKRNGHNGFFFILPLLDFMSGCKNVMWELHTQAKVLSIFYNHQVIEESDMEEAIKVVDLHSLFTPILAQIIS